MNVQKTGKNQETWHFIDSEKIWVRHNLIGANFNILGFLRIRNESLILKDTLNHFSTFVDAICVYEDASNDLSLDICKKNKKVVMIIENNKWLEGIDNRLLSETRHRGILFQEANNRYKFKWAFFSDADERYIGNFKDVLNSLEFKEITGVRVKFFDAYMTALDRLPYRNGKLLNFRKYFGPERRDILVFFRNNKKVKFIGLDSREPVIEGKIITMFFCQHYGKSLSEKHWEETCNYYTDNFPWDPYGKKWSARKGKSIHAKSDFNRPLYKWGKNLFRNSVINF